MTGIQALVLSVGEEEDLLDASNWVMSNPLGLNAEHAPDGWPQMLDLNWREGSLVVAPDGELWSMMCVKGRPQVEKTAIVKVHEDGRRVSFDPESGLIDFPGGMTKFIIRKDESTGTYWTLASPNINPAFINQRNVFALYASTDLLTWRRRATLLEDDSGLSLEASAAVTGFQYAGWQIRRGGHPLRPTDSVRWRPQLPRFQSNYLPSGQGLSKSDRLSGLSQK